jgi:hypothetical protein
MSSRLASVHNHHVTGKPDTGFVRSGSITFNTTGLNLFVDMN